LIYCDGGTEPYYGHQGSAVFCKQGGKPCWSCFNDLPNQEMLKRLTPDLIDTLSSIEFLPIEEQYRMGGSNVYSCCGTAHLMTSLVAQHLIGRNVPNRLILYYGTYELEKFFMENNPKCMLCGSKEEKSEINKEVKEVKENKESAEIEKKEVTKEATEMKNSEDDKPKENN